MWASGKGSRLSTGGGLGKRGLFTDSDESILDATRPVILNGIEELVTRPDLLDRSLLIRLPTISDKERKAESSLQAEFAEKHPKILGALLDKAVVGLKNLPNVILSEMPRMADFARWVVACEGEAFLLAYKSNRTEGHALAVDASAVAAAIVRLVETGGTYDGTVGGLLKRLNEDTTPKPRDWPDSARGLSGALTRITPNLEAQGLVVALGERTSKGKPVTIKQVAA